MSERAELKVLVLAPSLPGTSPGSRFRIELWMDHLPAQGYRFDYVAFEDERLRAIVYEAGHLGAKAAGMLRGLARRILLLRTVRRYDVVYIFEEAARIGPALIERAIHALGVPIVFDFCDPIHLGYRSPTSSYLSYLKFPGKTSTICRLSSEVLVGNRWLADFARRHNRSVTEVPITVDVPAEPTRPPSNEPPVIGWSGSHSTGSHLELVLPALEELRRSHAFQLHVMGAHVEPPEGVETFLFAWTRDDEASRLADFDIGVMPLPDDRWTARRSHLKVRQYMALGIPSVVSPVGVNADIIVDGVNGFTATSHEEWVDKLGRLLDDAELRRTIGTAGFRSARETFSVTLWTSAVEACLRRAASTGRR